MDNKEEKVKRNVSYDNIIVDSIQDMDSTRNVNQIAVEKLYSEVIYFSSSTLDINLQHDETTASPLGSEGNNQNDGIPLQNIENLIQDNTELITNALSRLQKSFDEKFASDALQQGHIDRLHQELIEYRAGLVEKSMRPLVHGVIKLHDDILKILSEVQEFKETDHSVLEKKLLEILEGFSSDVEILLEDNGIVKYQDNSVDFNPRRQRIVRKIATQTEDMHGKISDSLLPGFQKGDEIIEKERVAVYVYQSSQK